MKNKHVCMLLHEYLPQDNRPRREARALIEKGYAVDVICLKNEGQKKFEIVDGIHIYRLPIRKNRLGGLVSYVFEYLSFFILSFFKLMQLFARNRYSFIHVHNPPDILLFNAYPFKLFGTKVILDIHDPNPEMFANKIECSMNHLGVRLWVFIEWLSLKLADKIIVTGEPDRILLQKRGNVPDHKFITVMNTPDPSLYQFHKVQKYHLGLKGKYIVFYQGIMMKGRGLDSVVRAIARLHDRNVHLLMVGEGPYLQKLKDIVQELNLSEQVTFPGHVTIDKLGEYTSVADVCIIPFERRPINERGIPNKLFEYIYFKKPILASDLKGIRSVLDDDAAYFYKPGSASDLAEKIKLIKNSTDIRNRIRSYGQINKRFNWGVMKNNLWMAYDEHNT